MMTSAFIKNRPFLKWAGNKFRCLQEIIPRLPKGSRLIEPFTGSGAIFLNSAYEEYILAEQNPHLINIYHALKTNGEDFILYCKNWFQTSNNQSLRFYEWRILFNSSNDNRLKAALFLYLNRHAYNGLCRFNQKGYFNVPFGTYKKPYFPEKEMQLFHQKLQKATLIQNDYQETFKLAKAGDIIYCDPPYHPISSTARFTAYTQGVFLEKEHIQLSQLATQAANKGCHVLISNHDLPFTRTLYEKAYEIDSFMVTRNISCVKNSRKPVRELLAYFKPKG